MVDGVVLDCDANRVLVGIDVQHARQKADIHRLALNHMPLKLLEAACFVIKEQDQELVLVEFADTECRSSSASRWIKRRPLQQVKIPDRDILATS